MILTGTLIEIFDIVQITEKFRKREFVIKTNEQYPQEILIQLSQDKINLIDGIKIGENVDVSININGKGYTNKEGVKKWFNNISAWKIDVQYGNQNTSYTAPQPKISEQPIAGVEGDDDLPF